MYVVMYVAMCVTMCIVVMVIVMIARCRFSETLFAVERKEH